MKGFLRKYSRECRAAMLLVVVYSIHLFTVQSLLANPNDYLSRGSFSKHKTGPDQSTDYLLLLAKKNTTKQLHIQPLFFVLSTFTYTPVSHAQPVIQPACSANQWLSEDSYKRYLLMRVLLV